MKNYWQTIGITLVAAGVLFYPALKLYQYIVKKSEEDDGSNGGDGHHVKAFVPAYRGKHKPHHRSEHNGHN
jgi:hypothetical protein